jgi:hypothetical protein
MLVVEGVPPAPGSDGDFGDPMREGGSDRRTHGVGGEHYQDGSAGGCCYDGAAFSNENPLVVGEET